MSPEHAGELPEVAQPEVAQPEAGSGRTGPGLQRRVATAFAIYGALLTVLFGMMMWGAAHLVEDRQVARFLQLELEEYLQLRQRDPTSPLPAGSWLSAELGSARLPTHLRVFGEQPDGVYELSEFGLSYEAHLLVHTMTDGQRIYLVADETKIEVLKNDSGFMTTVVLVGALGVSLLGMVLGRMTARRALAPVSLLAERVRRQSLDEGATDLARGLPDDEVGLLARTLEAYAGRARSYLQRERRFTRDASHELRSPLTVIHGALELLEEHPQAREPALQRPLSRIRRAADDMAQLVDAFLWMAREEAMADGSRPQPLAREVQRAVQRHAHLVEEAPVAITVEVEETAQVQAPDGVLGILIGNLVANAMQFTQQGEVRIHGDGHRLCIDDTGAGIAAEQLDLVRQAHQRGPESRGFGLGLAICESLCRRFGWHLALRRRDLPGPRSGTRAELRFLAVSDPAPG